MGLMLPLSGIGKFAVVPHPGGHACAVLVVGDDGGAALELYDDVTFEHLIRLSGPLVQYLGQPGRTVPDFARAVPFMTEAHELLYRACQWAVATSTRKAELR